MRIRNFLLACAVFLLLLLLFPSCSRSREVMILSSGKEASVYMFSHSSGIYVEIGEEMMDHLQMISGLADDSLLFELFGQGSFVEVDEKSYEYRMKLLELLCYETDSFSILEALKKFGGDLRKTEFLNTINGLSGSFDDKTLSKLLSNRDRVAEYSLEVVLSKKSSWEDCVDFVNLWADQILR